MSVELLHPGHGVRINRRLSAQSRDDGVEGAGLLGRHGEAMVHERLGHKVTVLNTGHQGRRFVDVPGFYRVLEITPDGGVQGRIDCRQTIVVTIDAVLEQCPGSEAGCQRRLSVHQDR
ncbi:hypothetical protein D3C85_1029330 [compost metagenome]